LPDKNKDSDQKILPEHGYCFVCGTQNPKSIGIRWYSDKDGKIHGKIKLTKEQQGPPNFAHGGASAALLDEAMGAAAWNAGYKVVSVNLNIDFLKPVPLYQPVEVTGCIQNKSGRKIFAQGKIILENGEVAVEGRSILVEPEGFFDELNPEHKKFLNLNK